MFVNVERLTPLSEVSMSENSGCVGWKVSFVDDSFSSSLFFLLISV